MQNHEDLKALRIIAGLTQQEAALMLGVSRQTYITWEAGKSPLKRASYLAFLEGVGKTQDDVDSYFTSHPRPSQPPPALATAAVEAFIHALPRAKAEALCASILKSHPQPQQKKMDYDRFGYPLHVPPFSAIEFSAKHFEKANPGVDVQEALEKIEGADYPARARQREVLFSERLYPNSKDEDHLRRRANRMRIYDES